MWHSKVLITGATKGGLGHEMAINLARHDPQLIILSGRRLTA